MAVYAEGVHALAVAHDGLQQLDWHIRFHQGDHGVAQLMQVGADPVLLAIGSPVVVDGIRVGLFAGRGREDIGRLDPAEVHPRTLAGQ